MIKYKKYTEEELEELFQSDDWKDRIIAVKNHYKINALTQDKDFRVRAEIAHQGYDLDILVHDKDEYVRYNVACQGYGFSILSSRSRWSLCVAACAVCSRRGLREAVDGRAHFTDEGIKVREVK